MNKGDCFWGDPKGGNNDHLWLVMNDHSKHDGRTVLLNFSTVGQRVVKYSVPAGYHPDLDRESAICFGDMIVKDDSFIEANAEFGLFRRTTSLAPAKLEFLVGQAKTIGFVARDILKLI